MAQAVGAHSSYDEPIGTGGNREDLSSVIKDVSPVETPVMTMMGETEATATNHEWLTDQLEAAADNAHIEGDDANPVDAAPRGRLGNYTQIFKKHAVVTGTQEKVNKGGGIKSEMTYQMARRLKAIKRDGERAVIGVHNPKVLGTDLIAREMGSLAAYLVTNNNLAAASSAVTGDGTDVTDGAGVNRALTETILQNTLTSIFNNSGGSSSLNMVVTAAHKTVISSFTGAATRHVTTDNKKLVASIDVYVGDFHTVRIIPDRHCHAETAFILDPEYLKMAILRGLHSYPLSKNGDSTRKEIIWEWTLEVSDERAHGMIGDLN